MYLSIEDYSFIVDESDLNVIQNADETLRARSEATAIEQVKSYLRNRFDIDVIFAAQGEARNMEVLLYVMDISLYHMSARIPGNFSQEERKERFDAAIKTLERIQKGTLQPDLPLLLADDIKVGGLKWGSRTRLRHRLP